LKGISMKKFVLLGLVVAGSFACSSSGEEELQEAVVTSEQEGSETAEAAKPEEGASEAEMALIDAQAAIGTQTAKSDEEQKEDVIDEKIAAVSASKTEQTVYPTTSLLNLRQGPGMSHSVVRVASFGEAITLSGENHHDLWLKTTDGLWVSKIFVADSKPAHANDPAMSSAVADQTVSEVATSQVSDSDDSDESIGTDAE